MDADALPKPGDPTLEADEPHPDVQRVTAQRERYRPVALPTMGARGLRLLARLGLWLRDADPPAVASTADRTIPGPDGGVDVRIYRARAAETTPTVVFFHGGGFVMGSLDTHDLLCRHLTVESGCTVCSVDYRLAPEHPFPAAVADAYAAVEWAAAHPDAVGGDGRLAVAGDSAGGNLAAVAALVASEREGPAIDHQLLVYPSVGTREDHPSMRNHAGLVLTEDDLRWFGDCYYGHDFVRRNAYADPIHACDLSDLPPATVLTAGFDPLRDGALAYARRLADDGVSVRVRNYDDMVHGFVGMLSDSEDVDRAHEAVADLGNDVRDAFAGL